MTIPEGRARDRRNDLLIIRDGGTSFKIIDKVPFFSYLFTLSLPLSRQHGFADSSWLFLQMQRDDPTTVIEREDWVDTRKDMEKHLRKLRDFSVSNWF